MSSQNKDSSVDDVDFNFTNCISCSGEGKMRVDQSDRYDMNNPTRGLCIIINNRQFDAGTHMSERNGTDVDAFALQTLFKNLSFEVWLFHNQAVGQMVETVQKAAKKDHSNSDCLVFVVLSHGDKDTLYGCDKTITVDDLLSPFKKSPSLVGKPKLIIIQACRGTNLDEGHEVAFDGGDDVVSKIPVEADYLYAYSTVPGYYSWRNSQNGSWFVQAFVSVFEQKPQCDMLTMLTRVNKQVAFDFQSNAASVAMNQKKQVPYIASTLTKDFFLLPKRRV